ncbi:MAG TPA: 2-oxo acid dehydrogenase subunit E2 [Gammaproteobacteria bacterium]|nr:2-oxo acid dehydrogenase subunit E2 [Gammaproteobacteria bacterium]
MSDLVEVPVPRENNNDEFVTLIKWHFEDGDEVGADQPIVDVEGSKAVFEVFAPAAGFIRLAVREGDEIAVGGTLCRLFPTSEAAAGWIEAAEQREPVEAAGEGVSRFVRFSRSARALIEQRDLDPGAFDGKGLVRAADVLDFLGEGRRRSRDVSERPVEAPAAESGTVLALPGRRQALSPSKRTERRYIGASYRNSLQSSVTVCVPTRGLKAALEHATIGGNTTALIIYETARLLRKYPLFNACHDDGHAYLYSDINIGFAVDAGGGLKVPVVREADTKSLEEITAALRDLLVAYMSEELTAADQADGTFTVTDLSTENVFSFQPLINKGQSAILGVGAEFFPPGAREGVFNLTLQFDHQLAEGRLAAAFLNELAVRLQGYEAAFGRTGENAADAPHCARCYRDHAELRDVKQFLVQCVNADGTVAGICTGCLQGW